MARSRCEGQKKEVSGSAKSALCIIRRQFREAKFHAITAIVLIKFYVTKTKHSTTPRLGQRAMSHRPRAGRRTSPATLREPICKPNEPLCE
ncbi:hypothetical protein EVAR_100564_1 [Eumeta japonica]|uniref:Uncharacterized protein n=1 Tax=Eumeta variegata TaxID=151549 RepID=A0A4C1YEW9_EUMVA|nr:hypothetical protein EVAR_100564_1 [Eumeta japonica]